MGSPRLPELSTTGWCSQVSQRIRLFVQITPNAKKSEVVGVLGDTLKIKLQAQPIEGKANEALVRFLADRLDVPKSTIGIAQGQTNRRKTIEVTASGLHVADVVQALLPPSNQ
jgi:uncharacterized protein (TIGR00251 family)